MEKPRPISIVDAMRWNEEVNRLRLAHHERRCAEDAMYRKAYEYLHAEERRMWEQVHKPFAEILAAEAQQRYVIGKTKDGYQIAVPTFCPCHQIPKNMESQPVNDCMKDADKPQRIKTHEEVLRERASMEYYSRMTDSKRIAGNSVLAVGLFVFMLTKPDELKQRMKEMEEMQPYIDEIRETDKRYKNEEIKLSGFEW